MGSLVSFNGEICTSDDARISSTTGAALYGNGVFTTIAVVNGEPFVWEKHWRRLNNNCGRIGLNIAHLTEVEIRRTLIELISRNGMSDGRARITIFDDAASAFWSHTHVAKTSVLMITSDRRPLSRPFRLGVSPHRISSTSPLTGIKSCNYLDKHLSRSEARARGFDEAVQLNERGEIVSASMANLFWSKDGGVFTPSLGTGCLAGTTREFLMEKVNCVEVESGIAELEHADDIFLTSAGVGVVQVNEFSGRSLKGEPHPITRLLSAV